MQRLRPPNADALRSALASTAQGLIDPRCLHRLHAVLLVSVGRSCTEVAAWFGDDPRSVQRWVHAFDLLGPEGLRGHSGGGRPASLTPLQLAQLARELTAQPASCGYSPPRWSGKLLLRHLARQYGVQLGLRHCQRLLRTLGH